MIAGIEPAVVGAGIEVRMLDYDEQVELVNRSGRTVIVRGYEGEPYARVESGGPVFLNLRSPSRPLSNDRFGRTRPTGNEDTSAPPRWIRVGDEGRLAWYDRRSHYRGGDIPAAVEDPDERRLIRDFRIPIEVGGSSAWVAGSLYWTGKKSFPTAVFLALLVGTGVCGLFGAWALKRMREPGGR